MITSLVRLTTGVWGMDMRWLPCSTGKCHHVNEIFIFIFKRNEGERNVVFKSSPEESKKKCEVNIY